MIISDIIVGLQHGDEGKGKVVYHLIKNNNYTRCVRFNGGPNAGHTIYVNQNKIVTHQLPTGILYGIPSLIGPGCVIDISKLNEEINEVRQFGIDISSLLKISKNAHIILEEHIQEDIATDKVGSTKSGIRPVYRNKYNRSGMRVNDNKELLNYLKENGIDVVDSSEFLNVGNQYILFEGAQGFELDIDWGDYPYVTSSNCIAGYATCSGVSPKSVQNIWGIGKLYDTYVGLKKFQPSDEIFNKLGDIGNEFGATTGRRRQCNWLNIETLKRAIRVNGVTHLVINKCDIIEKLNKFIIYVKNGNKKEFSSLNEMKEFIIRELRNENILESNIFFSYSKEKI
tara:strand:+ start:2807 stop:3829 length:1023 start_codon:yes stop_codon:yes gene_type:complete